MHYDAIIIGFGLAGLAVTRRLQQVGKTVLVIDRPRNDSASRVASGLWNPIVMRKFNAAWRAREFFDEAIPFYQSLCAELGCEGLVKTGIRRVFRDADEYALWREQQEDQEAGPWMAHPQDTMPYPALTSEIGSGTVPDAGYLNVAGLLDAFIQLLKQQQCYQEADFQFNELVVNPKGVSYQNATADHLIFCQGEAIRRNPYFQWVPMRPKKGETLTVKFSQFRSDEILNQGIFVIPQPEEEYWVGSTFNHGEDDTEPTAKRRQELLEKLNAFVTDQPKVTGHRAGIRPISYDKRPLIGTHPKFPALAMLNGLGARGVTIAPWASRQLVEHLLNETELDPEVDLLRAVRYAEKKGLPVPG